jgi:hypothetical protein
MANEAVTIAVTVADVVLLAVAAASFGRRRAQLHDRARRDGDLQTVRVKTEAHRHRDW